jgi:hypothetical protein
MRQDINYAMVPEEEWELTILKKFDIIYIEGLESMNLDNGIVDCGNV